MHHQGPNQTQSWITKPEAESVKPDAQSQPPASCSPWIPESKLRPVPKNSTNSFVRKILLANPLFPRFYADVVLATRPNSHDRWQERDRNRGERGSILILGYDRVMRDFGGGNGGRPAPDAVCDPGFVATGFHVQTGEFYNTAWLDCAPMRDDGSLGEERRMTVRTGSPGGRPVIDAYCPQGMALRGLRGRTGASIDEAAGACSYLRDIGQRYDNPRTEFTQPVRIPRPGGRPADTACPAGAVVTGFRSMSGEYMDHLWILCSELQRSY